MLDFEGENAAIILNNEDFYKGMDVFTFLRDIGKNVTVNYMMAKDSVKNRIENREQGLSFTEFSYQIIQGYDFQYLFGSSGPGKRIEAYQQGCTPEYPYSPVFPASSVHPFLLRRES